MKAIDISRYIIHYLNSKGDLISNKKLQKLLFYVEAWSLVYLKSIIDEDFEAWVYGPVIPDVYREYKTFSYNPISLKYTNSNAVKEMEKISNMIGLKKNQRRLIDEVLNQYSSLSALQLENLTHSENPWIEARRGCSPIQNSNAIIDKKTMKKYYSSLVNVRSK